MFWFQLHCKSISGDSWQSRDDLLLWWLVDTPNNLNLLYFEHIVQLHCNTCLFWRSFLSANLAIYHSDIGVESRGVTIWERNKNIKTMTQYITQKLLIFIWFYIGISFKDPKLDSLLQVIWGCIGHKPIRGWSSFHIGCKRGVLVCDNSLSLWPHSLCPHTTLSIGDLFSTYFVISAAISREFFEHN